MAEDQTSVYMQVDGIQGGVTRTAGDESRAGWIHLDQAGFSIQRGAEAHDEAAEDDVVVKPVFEHMKASKPADTSSQALIKWMQDGSSKPDVKIDFCNDKGLYFLRYELSAVRLISYSLKASEDDEPEETLLMKYKSIRVTQRTFDSANKSVPASVHRSGYDLDKNELLSSP